MATVRDIKPTSKYVVFSNAQQYEPPYDHRDSGSYNSCIVQRFFDSDEELRVFLELYSKDLDQIKVFKISPVKVSLKLEVNF